jgi:hypothetical protein
MARKISNGEEEGEWTMSAENAPLPKRWTAVELRKLPAAERDAILAEQAALAQEEYRTNRDLTDFETYGEDDLYGESSGAQEG